MNLGALESAQFRQRIGESQQDKIGTGACMEPNIVVFGLHGMEPGSAELVRKPRQDRRGLRSRLKASIDGMRYDGTPLHQLVDANHDGNNQKYRQIKVR